MRENSGLSGRVSTKLKAGLVALLAIFAVSLVGAAAASAADGKLKLEFDKGQIAVLPEVLGPIEANPPAGQSVKIEATSPRMEPSPPRPTASASPRRPSTCRPTSR